MTTKSRQDIMRIAAAALFDAQGQLERLCALCEDLGYDVERATLSKLAYDLSVPRMRFEADHGLRGGEDEQADEIDDDDITEALDEAGAEYSYSDDDGASWRLARGLIYWQDIGDDEGWSWREETGRDTDESGAIDSSDELHDAIDRLKGGDQ